MPKHKTHKGIMKRIRVTKTGKVKHKPSFAGHLRGPKSGKRLRRLRHTKALSNPETKRLEKMLFRRLRGRDQPRSSIRVNPTPAERKAKREAKWAAEDAAKASQS